MGLPTLDGATVYPEKPVNSSKDDGHWIIGRRQQGFAVIPQRAGTLTVPATTLKWWNVQTGRPEVAQIPESEKLGDNLYVSRHAADQPPI